MPRRRDAVWMLRAMLVTQCALAVLVVLGDMGDSLLSGLTGGGSRAPGMEVPVAPGDQTRRFEPRSLPADEPGAPGVTPGKTMPPSLIFEAVDLPGHDGALLLTGAIAPGDARRFAAYLAEMAAPPSAIALHSPGGIVGEALVIGRAIRDAGLPVVVAAGAGCYSSCPYILAGGESREVSRRAQVGVHQHYFDQNTYLPAFMAVSDIQAGQGEVMAYLDAMGIDPMVMTKILTTPPDDIYVLMPEELEQYRLATVLVD